MNTLLVGYDLNKAGKNYEGLIEEIKKASTWWHHLDSTWLVKSDESSKEVRDRLKPYLDADDELLVINVTGDAAAWAGFSDRGSKWLKENL